MSFVLTVWEMPAGAQPPADDRAAEALLEQQQALPETPNARIDAWAEALQERFPPDAQGFGEYEGWGSPPYTGPTLNFGLLTHGYFFTAAYRHAVVQANRLGLNIYDPQTGEHHLADGRRLPDGEQPFDEHSADVAWHKADWGKYMPDLRQVVRGGDRNALHDLGRCYAEGHGVPRQLMLAGALMQLAAAPDDIRRRQHLETLKAWPADLRERQAELRERLRAAPELLPAIDAEVQAAKDRGARATVKIEPATFTADDWWRLREAALDGHEYALERLAHSLSPYAKPGGRPPWPDEPAAHTQWWLLAASRNTHSGVLVAASGLLSGLHGWPQDLPRALFWLRRAQAGASKGSNIDAPVERIVKRLAEGWNPQHDRPQAEQLLHEAMRTLGSHRLALLRQACELDHPEAWQRLGTAYQRGDLGLKADDIVGAALHLVAQKALAWTRMELGWTRPEALGDLDYGGTADALELCKKLIADTRPWQTIEAFQHELDNSTIIQVSSFADKASRVEMLDGRRRPIPKKPAAEPEPQRDPRWHSGHFTLLLGVTLPLLVLALGAERRGLFACALLTVHGAWRSGSQFDWSLGKRLAVGLGACIPGLGLLAAASVWLAQLQLVKDAKASEASPPPAASQ